MKGSDPFRLWLDLREKVQLRWDFASHVWVAVGRRTPGLVFEAPTLQEIAERLPVLEADLAQ